MWMTPLPAPAGVRGTVGHPLLALLCGVAAFALVVAFVRGYGAANPPATHDAVRRGQAKPVWTRAMWMQIVGAFALLGLMLWVAK